MQVTRLNTRTALLPTSQAVERDREHERLYAPLPRVEGCEPNLQLQNASLPSAEGCDKKLRLLDAPLPQVVGRETCTACACASHVPCAILDRFVL